MLLIFLGNYLSGSESTEHYNEIYYLHSHKGNRGDVLLSSLMKLLNSNCVKSGNLLGNLQIHRALEKNEKI